MQISRLKDEINFSFWCDFIERDFIENKFKDMLLEGLISGATTNPNIFKDVVSSSLAYEQQINMLQANKAKKIYEEIASTDIKKACQITKQYHDLDDNNGFISLQIDPYLCHNENAIIEEGLRLYKNINKDNLMIKIPATEAGYIAMEQLTSLGIAVNATLIFSPKQAVCCANALNKGIKESKKDTKSVISVFVSGLDNIINETLTQYNMQKNELGIINATKCYYEIEKIANSNIRTLFASTTMQSEDKPQRYYIDNLIFPNTINTVSLEILRLIEQKNEFVKSEIQSEEYCDKYFLQLKQNNINIDKIYVQLLDYGLKTFKKSFDELMNKVKL